MNAVRRMAVPVLMALALVLALGLGAWTMQAQAQGPGEPQPGTMQESRAFAFYGPTALAVTSTVYSAVPLTVQGEDVSLIERWHSADIFVTTAISGAASVTVTPQFSADGTNWTDADYTYVSNTGTTTISAGATLTTTEAITGTMSYTSTSGITTASAVTVGTYQITLSSASSAATDYLRLPLAGKYLRVKVAAATPPNTVITPTVTVVLRND